MIERDPDQRTLISLDVVDKAFEAAPESEYLPKSDAGDTHLCGGLEFSLSPRMRFGAD